MEQSQNLSNDMTTSESPAASGNSADYERACHAVRAASLTFYKAQLAYRAREIGDAEFLAARSAMMLANDAYDEAYITEASRQAATLNA